MSSRVLVTGGASGLGLALAQRLVARGDRVLVADLADARPQSVPSGAGYVRLDVRSEDDWAAAREWVEQRWAGLDILVNNAGVATGGRIDVESLADWERVIDINLLGVVRGCQTFVPLMKAQRSGHLVNTASLAGLVHGPGMSSYNATKAAVVALSETLRYELAPWHIHVTAICPGFFRTNLASSLQGSDDQMQKIARRLIEKAPLGVDEVADNVLAGIDAKKPVIRPEPLSRKAPALKRWARPLYDRRFTAMGHQLARKDP